MAFHHGSLSRLQAEEILAAARHDGSFLVRDSETIPGAYTLCVLFQYRVHQYRILPEEGKIYIQAEKGVEARRYPTLSTLIEDYKLRGTNNGLVCVLKNPIAPRESKEEDSEEDEDIVDAAKPGSTGTLLSSAGAARQYTEQSTHAERLYTDYEPFITRYFLQRFAQLDLSTVDGEFLEALKDYTDQGVHIDAQQVSGGSDSPAQLSKLLIQATSQLHRDMGNFLHKVDIMRQLFGPLSHSPLSSSKQTRPEKSAKSVIDSIDDLQSQLSHCKAAVTYLERKAVKKLQDLSTPKVPDSDEYANPDTMDKPKPQAEHEKTYMKPQAFETKLVKTGKHSRVTITVDIQAGKVKLLRPNKDVLEDVVVNHHLIRQIIKSTKDSCRLEFLADYRKKETYVFESARDREHFCQMIKQLKIIHATYQDVASVSVFIGTFNMADESPPGHLKRWLRCEGVGKSRNPGLVDMPHDLYVIGTQECGMSEKDWTNKIRATLHELFAIDLHVVASVTLWAIRLLILVKVEYRHKISHVQTSSVKTGIANTLGNKGAAGASFQFNGTSMAFICCHLTSGAEKNGRRNQNFRDIIRNLNLGPKNLQNVFDTSNQFHHLFFLGDLNYRLEGMEPEAIIKAIQTEKTYDLLLSIDQLRKMQDAREAFYGFEEEEITFPPSYRFEKGSVDKYAYKKQKKTHIRINVPSWCDRILWRSYPNTEITNTSYGCNTEVTTSDHKPVFASFDVDIAGQYVPSKEQEKASEVIICFEEVNVEVKTTSSEYFCLEFHSTCLSKVERSGTNKTFCNSQPGYSAPQWNKEQLPQLVPLLFEQSYLEVQHILLAVKTADGMESYGECVLGLQDRFCLSPTPFHATLMHSGEVTGNIRGYLHVKAKDRSASQFRNHRRRRSYEIIYMDTASLGSFRQHNPRPRVQHMTSVPTMPYKPEVKLRRKNSRSLEDVSACGQRSPRNRWSNLHSEHATTDDVFIRSSGGGGDRGGGRRVTPPVPGARVTPTQTPTLTPKTRLGQSSLSHSSVLPVSAATGSRASEEKREQSPQQQQQQQQRGRQAGGAGVSENVAQRGVTRNISSESEEGPPPPPRQYRDQAGVGGASYVTLRRPQTVNEWLLNLGLPQYIQTFHDHGFDHLDRVMTLRPLDLDAMKVLNKDHRENMLRNVNK